MSSPLISCVLPVFNCARFVAQALESVLAQTYRPIEVIAVDDGSTDATPGVLAGFKSRIRIVTQANTGHAAARNAGIRVSAGEFLSFLDADDLWHLDKLTCQASRLLARSDLGICFSHLVNFRGANPPLDRHPETPFEALPGYTSVTMLARRSLFDDIGMFDENLNHGNDRDWLLRASEKRIPFELLAEVLVYRRLHDSNRSAALASSSRAEYLRIIKASLDRRRAAGGAAQDLGFGRGSAGNRT